jgi:hypothetical protein
MGSIPSKREREEKKILGTEMGVVVHGYNPSTWRLRGRIGSSRLAWPI